MIDPEKLQKEKVNEITSAEAKHVLDNFVTESAAETLASFASHDAIGATVDALGDTNLSVEGFAIWMSKKVGGRNETVNSIMFLTTTFAVLEIGR